MKWVCGAKRGEEKGSKKCQFNLSGIKPVSDIRLYYSASLLWSDNNILTHTQHESWNQFFQFFICLIWMVIVDPLKEEWKKKNNNNKKKTLLFWI